MPLQTRQTAFPVTGRLGGVAVLQAQRAAAAGRENDLSDGQDNQQDHCQ